MTDRETANRLNDQAEYYRARAPEYDEWFLRRGRYDRGAAANQRWFAECAQLFRSVESAAPLGRVLELACGTGIFTERLVQLAETVTAVDSAPEMIAECRRRPRTNAVNFIQADLFHWQPAEKFDVVFFSFWLSHVPGSLFAEFWDLVRAALLPGGRAIFVDSLRAPESSAIDHVASAPGDERMKRRLNDGREFEIYKIFREPADLTADLGRLGWTAEIQTTGEFFLCGIAKPETQGSQGRLV